MQDIQYIENWNLGLRTERPLLIAGPCSAESREQVLETMEALAASGRVQILRAGVWKPRTRPGSFEGVGLKALPWLLEAKKRTGLPICVEVATPEHVELALEAGIDILWIGARTTVNPFAVQALADALEGRDIPVFVKNPINPDVDLWIGAIERLYKAGLRRIAAIHRGFSVYQSAPYRNAPLWELPIELRRRMPQLSLINDPSHICGQRYLLEEVAQLALNLDFDGLMIESHCEPDEAWSDAAQQLTPAALDAMMQRLVCSKSDSQLPHVQELLEELRQDIDKIDSQLLPLLKERHDLAERIGALKKEQQLTVLQSQRWREIFVSRQAWAKELDLPEDYIARLFQVIHYETVKSQLALYTSEQVHQVLAAK